MGEGGGYSPTHDKGQSTLDVSQEISPSNLFNLNLFLSFLLLFEVADLRSSYSLSFEPKLH